LAYIQGESRGQQALFASTLDELIPTDHVCRVIEAFVAKLEVAALGFERAEPGRDGAARLRSTGSAEAVPVWIPAAGAFVAAAGG